MNRRALVLFAHPNLSKSRANRALLDVMRTLEHVTVHDLYDCYPHFVIDTEREKRLLVEHDVIVFQHPIYWYSTPAILKEWQDQVLQHGWAYGEGGTALRGKDFVSLVTCGGSPEAYSATGLHGITLPELLRPLDATAKLCGLRRHSPIILYSAPSLADAQLRAAAHACVRQLETIIHANSDAPALKEQGERDGT